MIGTYLSRTFQSGKSPYLFGDAKNVLTRLDSKLLVDRIAHAIHERTVSLGRPARIAIYLPRDNYYLSSIFAVWQSANYYIPLNQAWPIEHTQKILGDAHPDLIIADTCEYEDLVPTLDVAVFEDYPLPSGELLKHWEERAAEPGIAYVIYTSGSTGDQKGVVISKKAFCSYIQWVESHFSQHQENLSLLINGEMSFDISLADLSFALAFETEIHISPDPKNMLYHARLIQERGIDTFYGVPSTINQLFSWVNKREGLDFEQLKTVFSGGDVVTFDLIDLVHETAPNARYYNMYGPTEVTMNCLQYPMDQVDRQNCYQGTVPTGLGFPHLEYRLIDPNDLTAAESEGELVISGDQCMDGYLNDPEKTAEAFLDLEGKRYYRTGDLFFKDERDVYTIVGRIDSIAKVQGYRVNTNTIGNLILKEDFVQDARCLVVETGQAEKRIVLFVTLAKPPANYEEILMQSCGETLPRYMIPSYTFSIDKFPLGETGKHDIKKLTQLAHDKIESL